MTFDFLVFINMDIEHLWQVKQLLTLYIECNMA